MRKLMGLLLSTLLFSMSYAQEKTIQLTAPNLSQGSPIMQALSDRKSTREYQQKALSTDDLSNLLWAAVGVNRPDGKRTSPTAMNKQEITVYAVLPQGAYKYEPDKHVLTLISAGDFRSEVAGMQDFAKSAPVCLVIVADMSQFDDDGKRMAWADAGIVSQNINLFCSGTGLGTVTRATMNVEKLTQVLQLKEGEIPALNNPVGYPIKGGKKRTRI